MDTTRPTFKFKTNIPALIHFESNEPQIGTGQYGQWYRYDIVVGGEGYVLFASKGLQERISKLGNLSGRNLEITKREGEGGKMFWEIRENGTNITPHVYGDASTVQAILPMENEIDTSTIGRINNMEQRLDKASEFVKNLSLRLDRVEKEINDLRAHMKS